MDVINHCFSDPYTIKYEKIKKIIDDTGLKFDELLRRIKSYHQKKIIAVYANCQSLHIENLMRTSHCLMDQYLIFSFGPVQDIHGEEEEYGFSSDLIKEIDILIYQNVFGNQGYFKGISKGLVTEKIIPALRKDALRVAIPNVYFRGYFPQHGGGNKYSKTFGKKRTKIFPYADYNIEQMAVKYSPEQIADIISKEDFYTKDDCEKNAIESLNELRRRENFCNVKISDYIEQNYRNIRMFYVVNHPKTFVLHELLKRTFTYLGIYVNDMDITEAGENNTHELIIYPSVKKGLGIKFQESGVYWFRKLCNSPANILDYVRAYLHYCSRAIIADQNSRKLNRNERSSDMRLERNAFMDNGNLKVAIIASMQSNAYSGGRYFTWIMAEALAEVGMDVYFISNSLPFFLCDFKDYPRHNTIHCILNKNLCDFSIDEASLDYVICIPAMGLHQKFYDDCLMFSIEKQARFILQNFETPNWYNCYIEMNRPVSVYEKMHGLCEYGCMIFSFAKESEKFARAYYFRYADKTVFRVWSPPINSFLADKISVEKEKQIFLFVRIKDKHKGGNDFLEILGEYLRGWTFVISVGLDCPQDFKDRATGMAQKYGIRIRFEYQMSDEQKFREIKRSKILLFPSYFEGYGYPPVEALYCGTRCIAYDLPVLREICGDALVYCEYGNVQDMRKKLQEVLAENIPMEKIVVDTAEFSKQAKRLKEILVENMENPKLLNNAKRFQYMKERRLGLPESMEVLPDLVKQCIDRKLPVSERLRLEEENWENFAEDAKGCNLYLWGTGNAFSALFPLYRDRLTVAGVIDGNPAKVGKPVPGDEQHQILAPDVLETTDKDNVLVLISNKDAVDEIIERLESMGITRYHSLCMIEMNSERGKVYKKQREIEQAEKIARRKAQLKEWVAYYPAFDDAQELTSHYYRACWYLPRQNNSLQRVVLCKDGCSLMDSMDYMGISKAPTDHIEVVEESETYEDILRQARVILLWKKTSSRRIEKWKKEGHTVINVTTNDASALEYANYCNLIWKYFKTDDERKKIILDSKARFLDIAKKIKRKKMSTACVFGTGPSLETSWKYDFSNCFSVVCNSIVQNRALLKHIDPWFITAGDVVSHLGVSKYAETFRRDLVDCLLNSKAYLLTTSQFGYILLEQHPEIKNKVILAPQKLDHQNDDLCRQFLLPKLDSTFNIHMLPLANTFCNTIIINGCDGKIPNGDNEDFWAHAESSQYRGLVDTGHKCHPTFDVRRQEITWDRYNRSVRHSIEIGEKKFGKRYYTLKPSYVHGLQGKRITEHLNYDYNEQGQIIVDKLCDARGTSSVSVRMDPMLKSATEKCLKEVGLTLPAAIQLFCRQVVNHGTIPFDIIGSSTKKLNV